MRPLYVAVCGPGSASVDEMRAAAEAGRLLAEAGAVVVTGGLGGVMGAASEGASEAGGLVLGILPGDTHDDANPDCTLTVPTGMGEARNALVVRAADAVIAVGGDYGTLSEIALAPKAGKPVVGIGTWELRGSPVKQAADAKEAVGLALRSGRENRRRSD